MQTAVIKFCFTGIFSLRKIGVFSGWKGYECTTWCRPWRTPNSYQFYVVSSCCQGARDRLDGTYFAVANHQHANWQSQDNNLPVFEMATPRDSGEGAMFRYHVIYVQLG